MHGAADRIILFVCVGALMSCSVSDVGEVQARRAIPRAQLAIVDTGPNAQASEANACATQLGFGLAGLSAANVPLNPINKGDFYQMRLRSGFISTEGAASENFFSDLSPSASGLGETSVALGQNWTLGPNLELLVVARVFDYGGIEINDGNFEEVGFVTDITNKEVEDSKVIYSSLDVFEGQRLSMDNLPIIGPVAYSGAGLGFQMVVLELDLESETQRNLVRGVLDASQTAAAIGSGLAGQALTTIASSLVDNGNTDDFIFEYRFGLDSSPSVNSNGVLLTEGFYLIVADYSRRQQTPWLRLRLDPATGKVFDCAAAKADMPIEAIPHFTDSTYFVIQVSKALKDTPARLAFENVQTARKRLAENGFTLTQATVSEATSNILAEIATEELRRKIENEITAAAIANSSGDFQGAAYHGRRAGELIEKHMPVPASQVGNIQRLTQTDYEAVINHAFNVSKVIRDNNAPRNEQCVLIEPINVQGYTPGSGREFASLLQGDFMYMPKPTSLAFEPPTGCAANAQ